MRIWRMNGVDLFDLSSSFFGSFSHARPFAPWRTDGLIFFFPSLCMDDSCVSRVDSCLSGVRVEESSRRLWITRWFQTVAQVDHLMSLVIAVSVECASASCGNFKCYVCMRISGLRRLQDLLYNVDCLAFVLRTVDRRWTSSTFSLCTLV